jgi:hypothetical protein
MTFRAAAKSPAAGAATIPEPVEAAALCSITGFGELGLMTGGMGVDWASRRQGMIASMRRRGAKTIRIANGERGAA